MLHQRIEMALNTSQHKFQSIMCHAIVIDLLSCVFIQAVSKKEIKIELRGEWSGMSVAFSGH